MEKLWFKGMRVVKGKNSRNPLQRKHLIISVEFNSDYTGETLYWYPSYKHLKWIIHFLAALHGKEEVTSCVLDDESLIKIYNNQIEKVLEGGNSDEIPNCKE